MGITKQYLKYVSSGNPFGIIASSSGQVVFIELNGQKGRYVASSSCEYISIWDLKTGEGIKTFKSGDSDGTCLSTNDNLIASGHSDGSVRLFDLHSDALKVTFNGHSTSVNCLAFDENGMWLASGGKDSEIVVWDTVSESGLYRLRGHKHVITQLQFVTEQNILISSSRDTFVKFWDLNTQHCFKTLTGHRTEVWDFKFIQSKQWLITGSGDSELRVWAVKERINGDFDEVGDEDDNSDQDDEVSEDQSNIIVQKIGSLLRQSVTPVRCLVIDESDRILTCHGKDALVETFKIRSSSEAEAIARRRCRKEMKKSRKQGVETDLDNIPAEVTLTDEVESLAPFKPSSKVKSCSVSSRSNDEATISLLLVNNMLEFHKKNKGSKSWEKSGSIHQDGHRSDVRTVSFSSDNYFILSASGESVKVWSRASSRCIASFSEEECGFGLCSLFAPGDRVALVGTKEGLIHLYDISSATRQEVVQVSDQAIWSMDMYPDKKGLVTGSEDHFVKFWDFEMVNDGDGRKRMSIVHKRSLQMDDSVLCVKISPNFKFIAVSLMDSTVKIFFFDTLKFFLNLYGHKFPVLTMDISSDSTIIATGSSDKNIKLWGMDFGDCHKSMFAHEDTITNLQFVPNTHQIFSCSKDKTLRQWDADHFEKILTLNGHQSEVWCLAISPNGKFVVSASHDKTLRVWEKTSEPLVLQEEQEGEREQIFEKNLLKESTVVAGERATSETGLAAKKSSLSLRGTELLLEAIDLNKEEKERKLSRSDPEPHPLLARYKTRCEDRFLLETLRSIKSSDLEEALLSLPFNYVMSLLEILAVILSKHWDVQLVNRCITFLCRIHFGQITSSSRLLPVIDRLRVLTMETSKDLKDLMGFNLAGLRYLQDKIAEREDVCLFNDAYLNQKEKKKKRKKNDTNAVPILKLI